mgnify:FL=1|tara:strand:- start:286 stop:786 length:501 start_codon:yes stop_codon:yes gene_type:complete
MTQTISATESSGADNARAKLAGILAIYELERFARLYSNKSKVFELSQDAAELLEQAGYDFDKDDITADHIRDVADDACRSECLGVDYSAIWSAGSDFDGQPQAFKVWLSCGGPSCYVTGEFGPHSAVDADSLRVWFSWAGPSDFLWIEHGSIESEALAWFVEKVAV